MRRVATPSESALLLNMKKRGSHLDQYVGFWIIINRLTTSRYSLAVLSILSHIKSAGSPTHIRLNLNKETSSVRSTPSYDYLVAPIVTARNLYQPGSGTTTPGVVTADDDENLV
jgi:hypothetical protein